MLAHQTSVLESMKLKNLFLKLYSCVTAVFTELQIQGAQSGETGRWPCLSTGNFTTTLAKREEAPPGFSLAWSWGGVPSKDA